MNISNNISSIQTSQTLLNTTANNVANVNTDGFVPSSTIATNDQSGSVTAQTRQADNTGSEKSQTDLSREIPNEMVAQRSTEANVVAIKAQDDVMGTLLDIKA
ncbi:flagellar basal body rod C-terminal domain-containing protein [Sulfurimonas microaerophilic]|uniref:flagellar basal body rod C-terminal domain-containing protein n=1 Tax=Sulfurimonas microaerophilic TaxID=3058392 RepID=UPI0027146BF0|nr:flagellar basal body protein [Sulfurimonas sp. hsl 1-7]